MKKKLLSLTLALALCMGLMVFPTSAANPVTVKSGDFSITFSDVAFEEAIHLNECDTYEEGTSTLYHLAEGCTVSIRNDGKQLDTEESILPKGYQYFSTFNRVGGALQKVENDLGGLTSAAAPTKIGASITYTAEEWANEMNCNVFGLKYDNQNCESRPVMFTFDETLMPKDADTKPSQPETPATASSFSDVKDGDWFKPYVDKVVAAGLMNGTGEGQFNPKGNLTMAQAVVLAYQIHSKANGGTLPETEGAWYMPYYEYCINNARPLRMYGVGDMDHPATRLDVVSVLHNAIPSQRLTAVKDVAVIPDVTKENYPQVYTWYQAGIVSGDAQGRFNGNNNITRAEMAVILCQINNL